MSSRADAPEVDVPALIDAQKISPFQIRVALLCAAVVFMDGFDAQAIGYVAPTLSKAWSLKPGELGWTFSAGLVGLMLGALAFSPKGTEDARVAALLARINPALRFERGARFVAPEEHPEGFPVAQLF